MHAKAPNSLLGEDAQEADAGVKDVVGAVKDVATDLMDAARMIENAAIALAGEVSGGQVTHLMLISQQLDRISKSLSD
ncbi:hypothetical protein [Pelagimonas varians]|uniref:Uncharacterized protein n=1 Tax=Pelagimonas varians TaxID=696760 RepID=A0A238L2F3_9RHOB|nr:hypothetical protein [Pelagimonas varians]PYG26670.1 hypothetical protein C8N36_12013 [Pelagimonas varians]SMX49040.1 hypothetical protein PEV8663_04068 [Pelagimonas varians]